MKTTLVLACTLAILAAAGGTQSRADWNGLATPGYTYCYCLDSCTQSYEDYQLETGGDCSALCDVLGEDPAYPCGAGSRTSVTSSLEWRVVAEDRSFDYMPFRIELTANGQRTGADTFLVEGETSIHGAAVLEVSVFRYDGDPSVFDGLSPSTVYDLVGLGIIADDDVLLAKGTSELDATFSFEVDVSGLADEEIVLMTTGDPLSGLPVPATDPWTAAALAVAVLALGTVFVLRRRRTLSN